MAVQGLLTNLNKPIVWVAGFAVVAAGSRYCYRQWKKDIAQEIQDPEPAVLRDLDEVAVLRDLDEVAVLRDLDEVAVLGDLDEVAVLRDLDEVAVLGDMDEVAVLRDLDEAAVLGDLDEAAVLGDLDVIVDQEDTVKQPNKARYTIEGFTCVSVVGCGTYGKVLLAECRRTREMFAIKAIKKRDTVDCKAVKRLMCEQKIMKMATDAHHPFLVSLSASFQTELYVCFVMEYAAGGDLLTHSLGGPFTEPRTVFHSACAVLGLEFLHERNVAHRDIKLANMLLDSEGYLKIADFGFCKEEMGVQDRASTLVGTIVYMAPEMLTDESYTRATDWWALGVAIFEMLVGNTPFNGIDDQEIHDRILTVDVQYPRFLSKEAILIIKKLLCRSPRLRLGSGERDAREVREQLFFAEMDWSALLVREIQPPFVPTIRGREDVSNFEDCFTSQLPTLTPASYSPSLTLVEQEMFRGFDYTADFA